MSAPVSSRSGTKLVLFARGDALAFVVGQQRGEQAPVTLMTAVARDGTTGPWLWRPRNPR